MAIDAIRPGSWRENKFQPTQTTDKAGAPKAQYRPLGAVPGAAPDIVNSLNNLDRVASQWDQNSAAWIPAIRGNQDSFRTLFLDPAFQKFIGPVHNLDVLDAGSGEGQLARHLASQGARVTGIDISPKLVQAAQAEEALHPQGITYHVDSFTNLKTLGNAQFDRVVSSMSLMDSSDSQSAFQAFHRVLRDNGELIFNIKHPFITVDNLSYGYPTPEKLQLTFGGSYFDTEPFKKVVTLNTPSESGLPQSVETIHYPRTVSDYINQLSRAGFRNIQAEEPMPSAAASQADASLLRYQKIPSVLMIRAQKAPLGPSPAVAQDMASQEASWGGLARSSCSVLLKAAGIIGLALMGWNVLSNTGRAYQLAKSQGQSSENILGSTLKTFSGQILKSGAVLGLGSVGALLGSSLLCFGFWPATLAGIAAGGILAALGYHMLSGLIPDPPPLPSTRLQQQAWPASFKSR